MKKTLLAAAALCALATGTAQAEMSGGTVKIGVLNDMSGLYADLAGQGSVIAAQMALEEFGGSVNGTKVEIVSADHQNKPDVGSSIVNKWFDTEGVDLVIDVPNSGVALATSEIASIQVS